MRFAEGTTIADRELSNQWGRFTRSHIAICLDGITELRKRAEFVKLDRRWASWPPRNRSVFDDPA
jgi:hypothetical protein